MDKYIIKSIEWYYKKYRNIEIEIDHMDIIPTSYDYYTFKCQVKHFNGNGYI